MPKKQSIRDLSVEELRWLLMEKRRSTRQQRLERYRRTGRVVSISSDADNSTLDAWQIREVADLDMDEPPRRTRSRRILDGLLLLIEVSAVVGFLFLVYSGFNLIRELNREVASAMEQPTFTPTPLITALVLPSGHTPPNSPGGAQPNEAEIPEHLRPLVQSIANIPVPTPGPEQAVRIQIPGIQVDAPIVQGDAWEQLKKGVGQHVGSANPGDSDNVVLSAHNDIFGEIFRDLDRLKPGDEIILYTNQRAHTYVVIDTQVVEPTAVEVMGSTTRPTVTLISCYPYLVDDQRIVVTGRLKSGGS
jgi:sortase A